MKVTQVTGWKVTDKVLEGGMGPWVQVVIEMGNGRRLQEWVAEGAFEVALCNEEWDPFWAPVPEDVRQQITQVVAGERRMVA